MKQSISRLWCLEAVVGWGCWQTVSGCNRLAAVWLETQHFCCNSQATNWILHQVNQWHDDVIKWKHFPRYWPFVRGIHQSLVNSPHKGQWRRALMFSLICVWINSSVNNREAGDLRRYRVHHVIIVMSITDGVLSSDADWTNNDNGLLPVGIKPLPEPMLIHQCSPVTRQSMAISH